MGCAQSRTRVAQEEKQPLAAVVNIADAPATVSAASAVQVLAAAAVAAGGAESHDAQAPHHARRDLGAAMSAADAPSPPEVQDAAQAASGGAEAEPSADRKRRSSFDGAPSRLQQNHSSFRPVKSITTKSRKRQLPETNSDAAASSFLQMLISPPKAARARGGSDDYARLRGLISPRRVKTPTQTPPPACRLQFLVQNESLNESASSACGDNLVEVIERAGRSSHGSSVDSVSCIGPTIANVEARIAAAEAAVKTSRAQNAMRELELLAKQSTMQTALRTESMEEEDDRMLADADR